ncbi:MAG: ISNCY family transposase, partial [Candidatus Omnitrophota bacterium]|nr:ISNCY family transposase [Candidatus Omnitrophota bacterium]
TQEELKRLNVIHKVLDKSITQTEAAGVLDLTDRHIRRMAARIAKEGDKGIVHKLRGQPAHNRTLDKVKKKALNLCKDIYEGFSPTLASEKLFERDKIKVSRELLRTWFIEEHIAYASRKARPHRNWRERKTNYGWMIQADGSHHDWFEGRGPWCVLMGQIDDATSKVSAEFHDHEGTLPFMASFKSYIKAKGIPISVYIDRHTTYKSNKKPSIEDELENREPLTQVGRALKELGVDVIFAHSAQAKGRVERLFRTFQDRLVKEMRLRKIRSIEEANSFLKEYLPIYNKRFSVPAAKSADLHRPLSKGIDLDTILCKKTERALRKDFTVAHDKKLYQIENNIRTQKVTVEERIDGSMLIRHKNMVLKFKEIAVRTEKIIQLKPSRPYVFPNRAHTPAADHPWRVRCINPQYPQYEQKEKGSQKEKELLLIET